MNSAPHTPDLTQALGHDISDKRIDILRRIAEAGSISEAARAAGVSYKAAWQALETLTNLAGAPLVDKAVGGSGGGGARLTPVGQQLLEAAHHFQQARAQVMAHLASSIQNPHGLTGLGLKTSMRNHLPCTITRIHRPLHGMVRVALGLGNDVVLHARITRESVQLLGLHVGMPALALCKATGVAIERRIVPRAGLNLLHGTVRRSPHAVKGGEASLELLPGLQLVGFAPPHNQLRKGHLAMAGVDESGIVIALTTV